MHGNRHQSEQYSEALTYDSVAHLSDRAITIPSDTTYNYDYAYNSLGAIDTITYPTSPAPTGTTATRYKIQYGYSNTATASRGYRWWDIESLWWKF